MMIIAAIHHEQHDEQVLSLRERIDAEMRETVTLRESAASLDGRINRELSVLADRVRRIDWLYEREGDDADA